MKNTAFYYEGLEGNNLLVETHDRDLALKTLADYTGKDFHWLLFRIGKCSVIQNTTVSSTYVQKFWDLARTPIKDFKVLPIVQPCLLCGK